MEKEVVFDSNIILPLLKAYKETDLELDAWKEEIEHVLDGVLHLLKEQYGPFICGAAGNTVDGVPEYFQICYALGSNHIGMYKLVKQGFTEGA